MSFARCSDTYHEQEESHWKQDHRLEGSPSEALALNYLIFIPSERLVKMVLFLVP